MPSMKKLRQFASILSFLGFSIIVGCGIGSAETRLFVSRIVGLPTETIELKEGKILINGNPVELPQDLAGVYYENKGQYAREGQGTQIPENSYFVMGDNSAKSIDSRHYGVVGRDKIVGKIIQVYR